jgi:hypothetical protein
MAKKRWGMAVAVNYECIMRESLMLGKGNFLDLIFEMQV